MAIKIIKFDLPINGTKVTTLEALRDNLTDEIISLSRSGQLERWFKSRKLQELAQAVADAVASHAENKALFLALCAVLEVEAHPDDISAIFDAPPEAGRHIREKNPVFLREDFQSDAGNPIFNWTPDPVEIKKLCQSIYFNKPPRRTTLRPYLIGMCMYCTDESAISTPNISPPFWFENKTEETLRYLPLLNFIRLNYNEEFKPYTLNNSYDFFRDERRIVFNFTSHIAIMNSNLADIAFLAPLDATKVSDDFDKSIMILKINTFNLPKFLKDSSGYSNYVSTLMQCYAGKTSTSDEEMFSFYSFINTCITSDQIGNRTPCNIKVFRTYRIPPGTLSFLSKEDSVYFTNENITISFYKPLD